MVPEFVAPNGFTNGARFKRVVVGKGEFHHNEFTA